VDENVKELIEAAHDVLSYLSISNDPSPPMADLPTLLQRRALSEGDRLRQQAEHADKRDAAILRFREALINISVSG